MNGGFRFPNYCMESDMSRIKKNNLGLLFATKCDIEVLRSMYIEHTKYVRFPVQVPKQFEKDEDTGFLRLNFE